MKKQFLLSTLLCLSTALHPHKLTNSTLKTMDNAGFFDKPVIDILQIRQKIKDLIHGKFMWQGVELNLDTTAKKQLHIIFKRIESIFGATYIVLDPLHPDLDTFVTPENKYGVKKFVEKITSLSYLQRQETKTNEGVFTGSYAHHPITKEKLPIYISDYTINSFDMRNNQSHMAVPAHNNIDFIFAQKYHLPIKVVITGQDNDLAEDLPKYNKQKTQLIEAYTREDSLCKIINSDFLNGSAKHAIDAMKKYSTDHGLVEYKQAILYPFEGKTYSLEGVKVIESTLEEQQLQLTTYQQESAAILMNYAQADFLEIVEQFLLGVLKLKVILVDLIEESCKLRHNNNCYFLKWSQLDESFDTVRTTFKRDIVTVKQLFAFCSDLVDFLSDLVSSCPHALENLKKLKNK